MTSYLQNSKSYQTHILQQKCFYGYNDSYRVSFQSVDVNLVFFGIRASDPPPPCDRLLTHEHHRHVILLIIIFLTEQTK